MKKGAFIAISIVSFLVSFGLGIASKSIASPAMRKYSMNWDDNLGTLQKDLAYGEGESQKFDLYLPKDNSKDSYGLAVYLHAGGFTSGDKSDDEKILSWLCSKGYVAAGINYTLRTDKNTASVLTQSNEIKEAIPKVIEAAKEAGEVVILDDNFKSIKDAILYGRTIYNNILKFCKFQLVINVGAVIVSAIAPFFGIEEPLKVTHLLFVNLVMDSLGAIMLGNEPALEKYMLEKPRKRDENIVSNAMMTQIIVMGLWLTIVSFIFLKCKWFLDFFGSEEKLLTGYFVLFIWAALFNGFNVRDEKFGIFSNLSLNPGFIVVFISIVIIQALIVNVGLFGDSLSWVGKMFSCVPFDLKGWGVVIALAFTMIPVDMIRKCFVKDKK